MKDFSNIIRGFEIFPYKSYERRRPKHDPTDSYFYLSRQIAKCMMRDDVLNLRVYPVRTEITDAKHIPISHVFFTDDNKSKEFLVDENLSHFYSTNKGNSKSVIVNESSTEEIES